MQITMRIRWSAKPIGEPTLSLGGSTEYLVTGAIGEPGLEGFWAHSVIMTQEMLEDGWLPDIVARIERLARVNFPAPPMFIVRDAEGARFLEDWKNTPPGGLVVLPHGWGPPIDPELARLLTK